MYRIEVKPGEETVFRTIDELATGIRNGFITPRARIFHAASQKWLPIEFHPHYKKALDGDFAPAPVASPPSLSALPTPVLTPLPSRSPSPQASPLMAMRAEVESRGHAPAPAPAPARPAGEPEEAPEPAREEKSHVAVALLEPPRPMPAPELVLPNITYPELPPAPEPQHRPALRRGRRGSGRPALLIGAAAMIVFAAHRLIGARAGGLDVEPAIAESARAPRPDPAAMQAASRAPEVPVRVSAPSPAPAPQAPVVAKAMTPTPPVEPMTPGPAFAASVPTRIARMPASTPTPAPVGRPTAEPPAPALTPAPQPAAAALEPAPAAIDVDLPVPPVTDSLSQLTRSRTDSAALKRILKAVSGKKGGTPSQ